MWVQNHLFTCHIVCYVGFTLKLVSIFHFLEKDKDSFKEFYTTIFRKTHIENIT